MTHIRPAAQRARVPLRVWRVSLTLSRVWISGKPVLWRPAVPP